MRNTKRAFFCAPFLSLSERKERIPAMHGEACGDSFAAPMAPIMLFFSCTQQEKYALCASSHHFFKNIKFFSKTIAFFNPLW